MWCRRRRRGESDCGSGDLNRRKMESFLRDITLTFHWLEGGNDMLEGTRTETRGTEAVYSSQCLDVFAGSG